MLDGRLLMTWEIRFLIILFAIMFFWVAGTEAFASTMSCPTSSEGIVTCIDSSGKIIIINR